MKRSEPEVGSRRRSISLPVVVFPQPDSPTRPTVSPRRMSKLTPSTAWTFATARRSTPLRMGNHLRSCSTR